MSQYGIFLVGITISPYLHLFIPFLAKIGLFLLGIWTITGLLNSNLKSLEIKKKFGLVFPPRKIQNLQEITEFLDSSLPLQRLQKSILLLLDNLVVQGLKIPLKMELQSPTCHLESIGEIAMSVSQGFIDCKEERLELRIWVRFWSEILKFFKIFKKLRKETLKENLSASQFKKSEISKEEKVQTPELKSHLDDYNSQDEVNGWDFNTRETGGDGVYPSQDLDQLLLQISCKFVKKGYIHPAVGSPDQEKAYIRLLVDQVFYRWGWKETPGNKLSRLLFREVLACFGIWGWIDKWSKPEVLNNFISEKVKYSKNIILN